ncbi:molecular chaperone SurA [Legionella taurinensis]|uniref:Chaperone SurA n=1 Tax=Legionella taurinensis TaxID=70611 RepID=A0A3A5L9Q2_9GAMM|nr:peptidylprolyl isomerase [Legionella taurinensis]MDX1836384.1 peptidylprolyl isomerase [Legionella taurinensis]PUT41868.1 molecular chaperone SurA [Legionella taurinensis]PUT44656.1 molecular chaperone SurA [Legionella taurinensis]PUT47976.1 molecular chaperone SurA [Legionella taurinensis]PUT48790.1 molecular chaperone SurA [Legionella taurinensis]
MLKRIVSLALILPTLALAQPLDSVVAIVNDGVITSSELNTQVDALRQQMQARKMQMPPEKTLRKQVLQHLIDVDLQLQLAKQNDMTVDSTELNEAINKIAANNHLTLTELREELTRQGISWQSYRENIRKEILISRVQQKAVGKDVSAISNEQVEDYLKTAQFQDKTQFTYHLQNIVIPLPEEPTTEQLNKARQKAQELLAKIKKGEDFNRLAIAESSGEFALEGGDLGMRHLAELPEVFAKQVVNMKTGQIAGPIRTGNGFQLIRLIAIGGAEQKHEVVKTHVRHILLKQDASMTAAEAEKQANNLYQQLKSGKDFAHMAKQYSLDAASAVKGGDLGWVNSGELVMEFEKAMDALPINAISKPVKSGFGWHIIQVLGRKKVDDTETFKRQQVRAFLQQRKFTEAVQNWQQHLRADAYVKILDKDLA